MILEIHPRQMLREFVSMSLSKLAVSDPTKRNYCNGNIQDPKLPTVCQSICLSIGRTFEEPARRYFYTLMIAWFTTESEKRRELLDDWRQGDLAILKHAFESAAHSDPKLAIGIGTTLGLSALWEGLVAQKIEEKKSYAEEAISYWQRTWAIAEESGKPLEGYLRHRILVWFAVADFNAVDRVIHLDDGVREALIVKWTRNNVLKEFEHLVDLLPADCGPVFGLGIFAAIMREWSIAGQQLLEIEERALTDDSCYFQTRLKEFYEEPIIDKEFAKIRAAADEIKAAKAAKNGKTKRNGSVDQRHRLVTTETGA